MNPPQGEVALMAITSQPNQETKELTRLFHHTKKKLPILSYKYMTNVCVKPVLKTFAEYEPKHESPPFSINDRRDVTATLIRVTDTIQDPKDHVNPNKPGI